MLNFRPLTLADYDQVKEYLAYAKEPICDTTPGTVFMWRKYFQTQFCIEGEALFFRICYPHGRVAYSVPVGPGALEFAFDRLRAHIEETGELLLFSPVTHGQAMEIGEYFTVTEILPEKDWADYVYDASRMQTFSGKKLHGQRNHLNRFNALYPHAKVEVITSGNVGLCRDFLGIYEGEQELSDVARAELSYVAEILDNYELYGLLGTCVLVDGQVVAFAIGSIRENMLYEHIEKASRQFLGSYQKIVSEFAKMYAHPAGQGITLINREDDMGNLSLRASKLAYHPVEMLDKYTVRVEL